HVLKRQVSATPAGLVEVQPAAIAAPQTVPQAPPAIGFDEGRPLGKRPQHDARERSIGCFNDAVAAPREAPGLLRQIGDLLKTDHQTAPARRPRGRRLCRNLDIENLAQGDPPYWARRRGRRQNRAKSSHWHAPAL